LECVHESRPSKWLAFGSLFRRWLGFGWLFLVATQMMPIGKAGAQQMNKERGADPGEVWEKAAGGPQEFEVASVHANRSGGDSYSSMALDGDGNAYWVMTGHDKLSPEGSLFSAKNQSLLHYIVFAYRLNGTEELALRFDYFKGAELHVPDWVRNDRYDIEARAPRSATKDEMRLMMQSLLEDRFKLRVHWETRQVPVFALVEEKPGKLGPQLKPHPASDDCLKTKFAPGEGAGAPAVSALPIPCGWIARLPVSQPGEDRIGGRDVPLSMLASSLPWQTGLVVVGRPVIDRTGLGGDVDFQLDWVRDDTSEMNNSESGGTFREALKNQLGLKLEPANGPIEVLVIDHVEQPGEN